MRVRVYMQDGNSFPVERVDLVKLLWPTEDRTSLPDMRMAVTERSFEINMGVAVAFSVEPNERWATTGSTDTKPKVRVITGYGPDPEEVFEVEVDHFAEFMRGPDGLCAVCHGDDRNWHPKWTTCPVCQGRPS